MPRRRRLRAHAAGGVPGGRFLAPMMTGRLVRPPALDLFWPVADRWPLPGARSRLVSPRTAGPRAEPSV